MKSHDVVTFLFSIFLYSEQGFPYKPQIEYCLVSLISPWLFLRLVIEDCKDTHYYPISAIYLLFLFASTEYQYNAATRKRKNKAHNARTHRHDGGDEGLRLFLLYQIIHRHHLLYSAGIHVVFESVGVVIGFCGSRLLGSCLEIH